MNLSFCLGMRHRFLSSQMFLHNYIYAVYMKTALMSVCIATECLCDLSFLVRRKAYRISKYPCIVE